MIHYAVLCCTVLHCTVVAKAEAEVEVELEVEVEAEVEADAEADAKNEVEVEAGMKFLHGESDVLVYQRHEKSILLRSITGPLPSFISY